MLPAIADQLLPFQRARLVAATPPPNEKSPPTNNSAPRGASEYTRAVCEKPADVIPEPNAVHCAPSHLPTLFTVTPLAVGNAPAAYKSLPLKANAKTQPSTPSPTADQFVPFQRAIDLAGKPPALENLPPA